jgi:hypothetical protein
MYGRVAWTAHIAAYVLIAGVIAKLAIDMVHHRSEVSSTNVSSMVRPVGAKFAVIAGNEMKIAGKRIIASDAISEATSFGDVIAAYTVQQQLIIVDDNHVRFHWDLPTDEEWLPQRAKIDSHCVLLATHNHSDASYRCLDPQTGALLWSSQLTGGEHCSDAVRRADGLNGYDVACPGWIVTIGDHHGEITSADTILVRTAVPKLHLSLRDHRLQAGAPFVTTIATQKLSAMVADWSQAGLAATWIDQQLIISGAPGGDAIAGFQTMTDATAQWVREPDTTLRAEFVFATACDARAMPSSASAPAPMIMPAWISRRSEIDQGHIVLVGRGQRPGVRWKSQAIAQSTVRVIGCRENVQWMSVHSDTGSDIMWGVDAQTGTTVAAFSVVTVSRAGLPLADVDISQLTANGIWLGVDGVPVNIEWRSADTSKGLRAQDSVSLLITIVGPLP